MIGEKEIKKDQVLWVKKTNLPVNSSAEGNCHGWWGMQLGQKIKDDVLWQKMSCGLHNQTKNIFSHRRELLEEAVEKYSFGNSFLGIYFSPRAEEILNWLSPGMQINSLDIPHSSRDVEIVGLAFLLAWWFFSLGFYFFFSVFNI